MKKFIMLLLISTLILGGCSNSNPSSNANVSLGESASAETGSPTKKELEKNLVVADINKILEKKSVNNQITQTGTANENSFTYSFENGETLIYSITDDVIVTMSCSKSPFSAEEDTDSFLAIMESMLLVTDISKNEEDASETAKALFKELSESTENSARSQKSGHLLSISKSTTDESEKINFIIAAPPPRK